MTTKELINGAEARRLRFGDRKTTVELWQVDSLARRFKKGRIKRFEDKIGNLSVARVIIGNLIFEHRSS